MSKVKNIALWISAIIAAVSSLYGGYSFFSRKIIESDRKQQSELVLIEAVNKLVKSDSISTAQFYQVIDTLSQIKSGQDLLMIRQKKLNNSFVEHLKLSKRVDELINYYEKSK
jgi:hypothetical protein